MVVDPVIMGRIAGAYGVRGWIKVQPFSAERGALKQHRQWWVGRAGAWRALEILEAEVRGASLVARIVGIDDRDAAETLRGLDVAVARSALPASGENEVYWSELVGLAVVNTAGERLGVVEALFWNGAHEVVRVRDGELERLLPYVAAVVKEVDLPRRQMTVEWARDW